MDISPAPGTKRVINGQLRVFHDGYWIKAYEAPADSLSAKRQLIEALTRRLFNHVEHGINIPGWRLKDARHAYETEQDPAARRVKGAMLAGALFNRATDIISKLVEMQALGVDISADNGLLRQCGACLQEALSLGRLVLHRSGEEGIDELWGEPLRAFSIPVDAFFESRYIKIAQTMRDIDRIADCLIWTFRDIDQFDGLAPLIPPFAESARLKCETLRTDEVIFDVWPAFVCAGERLLAFSPRECKRSLAGEQGLVAEGMQLIRSGSALVTDITRARTPMPKTTREYVARCERFRERYALPGMAPQEAVS